MFFRKKTAIEKDLRSIRKSAVRTMFCVVLLISGIAPAFCMWWDYRGDVPIQQQLSNLWTVALRTYPLTLSIAIIAMSRQLGWFKYGRVFFMGAVITAGASLGDLTSTITGQEGHAVQAASIVSRPDHPIFGPLVNSFNYLVGYYRLYGARHFFAAILVGSFAGRSASKILRHVPKKEQLRELVEEWADVAAGETAELDSATTDETRKAA